MACGNCGGASRANCSCGFVSTSTVTFEGAGSAEDPIVVNVAPQFLSATSTASMPVTMGGDGGVESPLTISLEVAAEIMAEKWGRWVGDAATYEAMGRRRGTLYAVAPAVDRVARGLAAARRPKVGSNDCVAAYVGGVLYARRYSNLFTRPHAVAATDMNSTGAGTKARAVGAGEHGEDVMTVTLSAAGAITLEGAASLDVAVTAGEVISASARVKCNVPSDEVKVFIRFIGTGVDTDGEPLQIVANEWATLSVDGVVAPAGATAARIAVSRTADGQEGAGTVLTVGRLCVSKTPLHLPPFSPNREGYWSGTVNGSASHLWTTPIS